jgi:TonB family protein
MKRLQNVGDQTRLLMDSPQSDSGGLLKTGVFSMLLHIILIIFLILNLKTGITKGHSPVYRVTITPFSRQNISNPYPLQALPTSQPVLSKTQIQKEEEKRPKEEIRQEEPAKEPKQPRQHQEDEETIEKPIPLPMASTSSLNADSNLEKDENLAIPPVPSPGENNKNIAAELIVGEGSGAGTRGSPSGSSVEGQGREQEGSRWGGPGEGTGRGSSGWAISGKEPGMGSGVPGLRGSGKGTGAGIGTGTGAGTGTGTGTGKKGQWGGSGDGRSGVSSPRYGENPKPVYPLEARQKEYQGEVLLKVEVLQNGRVGEVEVEKSSGYEVLDQSALATVKKWRFIPAKKGGVAIPCWVNIPFKFQLRDISF